jgi:hypothetical protein
LEELGCRAEADALLADARAMESLALFPDDRLGGKGGEEDAER